jgi:LPXTG-motif cell wall-anchored protein
MCLALASTTLLAFPAGATESSWSIPVNVSVPGLEGEDVRIASHNGLAVAVWEFDVEGSEYDEIIQSSTSLNGAAWSTPVNLSLPGGDAYSAEVEIDSNGLAIAVWQRYDGSDYIIQSSKSLNGAAWSTPVNLSLTGGDASSAKVAIDSNGLATAVWYRYNGSNWIIQSSTSLNGAAWSTPVNLSLPGEDATTPQVAIDSNGLATAVWEWYDGSDDIIQSSTSLNGAAWSTPVDVSLPLGSTESPRLAISSTGLATAVWERYDGSDYIIQSSTSLNGAAWSTPVNLSLPGGNAYSPRVAIDSTGLATAVWARDDGSDYIIQSSTSLNGAAWSVPVNISPVGEDTSDPQLTVNSSNLVTVVWEGEFSDSVSDDVIKSSTSLNGAAWSTPVSLFADEGLDADDPEVTVDSTGLVTAVWERDPSLDDGTDIIQSSFVRQSVAQPTPTPTPTPTLAKTGADFGLLIVAGTVAAVAGSGLLAVSRRKRSA